MEILLLKQKEMKVRLEKEEDGWDYKMQGTQPI